MIFGMYGTILREIPANGQKINYISVLGNYVLYKHRGVASNYSSPWLKQSKKQIPRWVSAFLVARQGLEPWTHALKGRCSTN